MEEGKDGVKGNPARDVPFLKPSRIGGFPTWTAEDVARFEARHPLGTKAHLALALLLYTGVRRSDLVRLGRQHVRNGAFVFTQHKGRSHSPLTLTLPILPALQSIIDASPTGDLTFLVTEQGKPFTAAGFTNWFRDRLSWAELYVRYRSWCADENLTAMSADMFGKRLDRLRAEGVLRARAKGDDVYCLDVKLVA